MLQSAPAMAGAGRRVARWVVLLGVLGSAGALAQPPACQLLTESEGLVPLPGCAVANGQPRLDATALAALPYDAQGLAVVHAGGSFHYVNRAGRSLAVITWDNGPDTPQEGLVGGRVRERNCHGGPSYGARAACSVASGGKPQPASYSGPTK